MAASQRLHDLRRHGRWALTIAWDASRGSVIGLAGVLVVRGLVPAGLALAARGLINAALETMEREVIDQVSPPKGFCDARCAFQS